MNIDDEIEQITNTIDNINITLGSLEARRETLLVKRAARRSNRVRRSASARGSETYQVEHDFRIGDIVEVKDNYKGRRGIQGRITEIHGAQVRLVPLNGSAGFRKFKENIKLIRRQG